MLILSTGAKSTEDDQGCSSEPDEDDDDQGDQVSKNDSLDYLGKIGQGGFGTVFRVRHKLDDGVYVVKKIEIKGKVQHSI